MFLEELKMTTKVHSTRLSRDLGPAAKTAFLPKSKFKRSKKPLKKCITYRNTCNDLKNAHNYL